MECWKQNLHGKGHPDIQRWCTQTGVSLPVCGCVNIKSSLSNWPATQWPCSQAQIPPQQLPIRQNPARTCCSKRRWSGRIYWRGRGGRGGGGVFSAFTTFPTFLTLPTLFSPSPTNNNEVYMGIRGQGDAGSVRRVRLVGLWLLLRNSPANEKKGLRRHNRTTCESGSVSTITSLHEQMGSPGCMATWVHGRIGCPIINDHADGPRHRSPFLSISLRPPSPLLVFVRTCLPACLPASFEAFAYFLFLPFCLLTASPMPYLIEA